ncbi:hypothetical protein C7212DRAFT_314140 [Tuber magnatum]|uniref:Uncharacterized protein n=1 Tax=Tuber magnatum TaxID=42249 RepID=A0A317SSN1_9PEZI|nr:hypothetical protein C7212DRAFT_314140 [Tuber magnatum]
MYVAGFILIGKFLSDTDAWGTEAPIIYLYKAVFGATIIAMVSFFVTGVIGLEMRGEAKSNKKYPLPTAKYEPLDDCRANPLP